jgi:hypothetical protein
MTTDQSPTSTAEPRPFGSHLALIKGNEALIVPAAEPERSGGYV